MTVGMELSPGKAFSAAPSMPTSAAMPQSTNTPAVPTTSTAVPRKAPTFYFKSMGQGCSRHSQQGSEEDAGVVVGVVEETRACALEKVEEIPILSRAEENGVPDIGNLFHHGYLDT